MKVTVQLFSYLKDVAGASSIDLEITEPTTGRDLIKIMVQQLPELVGKESHLKIAVGEEYIDESEVLDTSREIAIFPPVSGG